MFDDGSVCNILDIVRVQTRRRKPSYLQPENIEIDEGYYLTKLGASTLQEVIKLHPLEHHTYILEINGTILLIEKFMI